jgi:hypothetical protein
VRPRCGPPCLPAAGRATAVLVLAAAALLATAAETSGERAGVPVRAAFDDGRGESVAVLTALLPRTAE